MMDSGPEVEKVYPVREFTDSPNLFPSYFRGSARDLARTEWLSQRSQGTRRKTASGNAPVWWTRG
jgi:hypothetical protein